MFEHSTPPEFYSTRFPIIVHFDTGATMIMEDYRIFEFSTFMLPA